MTKPNMTVSDFHARIFDHKWLDPACVTGGCQSLLLKQANDILKRLAFMARTSGGTAGPDSELMKACDEAEAYLAALSQRPSPQPIEMLVDREWLRGRIKNDPDLEVEVRPSPHDEGEAGKARQVLQRWLDETPRYLGDDPRAEHYQRNVRALETAIAALSAPKLDEGVIAEREALNQLCARVEADAVSALRYIERHHGRLSGVGWDRVFDAHDELFRRGTLIEGGGK